MKTSNKILLGLACFLLVVFTANQLGLYAKLKANSFITEEQLREKERDYKAVQKFSTVELTGLNGVNIVISDSFGLRINHDDTSYVTYDLKGDRLEVRKKDQGRGRDWIPMDIYCPTTTKFELKNGSLWLNDSNLKYLSALIDNGSQFHIDSKLDSADVRVLNESSFELSDRASIGTLNLDLMDKSSLNVNERGKILQFGKINISDSARIEADGGVWNALMKKGVQK
ncbi:MAG: hypothetical protein C5B52_04890 [Bacteroidetes bacterium]|nr:MAG: hypothetical protein C5B52_04890 [Bacteroidota bacterium]